ncbi:hypothetical protein MUN81_10285 [Hymenobacter sp. 5317J-9]|uniref:hypothetical protein n=1 Tax=Hymenobacter sp. 5317J-9 TaxID=2932250 RepID=UPI001FD65BFF|nr:hypothetical protein [Hymenobacter sp. 5317J-9]UOQ99866.1 hypothetical protein MUN81_10285 [Hymenobacter sp. 5317J-9]
MNIFSRQSGLFVLALLLVGSIIAAKAPAEGKQYDYVMVRRAGYDIAISGSDGRYEVRNIKSESKHWSYDEGPLFKVVNEFESKGYEVYSANTFSTTNSLCVLLRKPK